MSVIIEQMQGELEEIITNSGIDPKDLDVDRIVKNVVEELKEKGLYPRTA